MRKINITEPCGTQRDPAARQKTINDLLLIYSQDKMYINEKGYLQKLVELLYELGYYENNKSIFGVKL